jgi:Ca2+-binding RTX toxin-like protein
VSEIFGSNDNDTLIGTVDADSISGLEGDDRLEGKGGNDVLNGDTGADELIGGAGNDAVFGGEGNDHLFGPNFGEDAGNDSLDGGEGADILADRHGSNVLQGGLGDDIFEVLIEAPGSTLAYGGDGRDRHEVAHTFSGRGLYAVADFAAGADGDLIDVMPLLFASAAADVPGYLLPVYHGGNPFDPSLGFLRLYQAEESADTELQWDFDGLADSYAWETVLTLQGVDAASLTANNFVKGISPDGSPVTGDSIPGNALSETLDGGFFNDTLTGLGGNDTIDGGGGGDLLQGGSGNDCLVGGVGDDRVSGGAGDDELTVDSTNPISAQGDDSLFGGDGNDTFLDFYGANVLDGGAGDDRFDVNLAGGATALASGGLGQDTYVIWAPTAAFTVDDFSVVDIERDLLDVDELLNYSAFEGYYAGGNPFAASSGILRLQQQGADVVLQTDLDGAGGAADWTTTITLTQVDLADIASANFVGGFLLDGSDMPGQTFTGADADESSMGGFFDDTLSGGAGDDTLDSRPGNDLVDGGPGMDQLTGGAGDDTVTGGEGNDRLYGGNLGEDAGDDLFVGGAGDDTLADFRGENTLEGGDGNDRFEVRIDGDGGNTLATGGVGQDTYELNWDQFGPGLYAVTDFQAEDRISVSGLLVQSMLGPGYFVGGNPFDPANGFLRLTEADGNTSVEWDRDGAAGSAFEWETLLTLQGVAASSLTAASFTDNNIAPDGIDPDGSPVTGIVRTGTEEADSLHCEFFNDTLEGFGGDDRLEAGGGDDSLDGGAGDDFLIAGYGDDQVSGGDGNDEFGIRPDKAVDTMGDDTLLGGAGDDSFFDIYGDNVLDGGEGADSFIVSAFDGASSAASGGAGRDLYVLRSLEAGSSFVVTDFAAGVGGDLLDANPLLNLSAFDGAYSGGNPFTPGIGILQLVQEGAQTQVQWDRDGPGGGEYEWQTVVTLETLDKDTLTSDNFVGKLVVGTEGDDELEGEWGNDTLQGLAGDDTLDGSLGKDSLEGGAGNDVYYVDHAQDLVVETSNAPPLAAVLEGFIDTVFAAVSYSLQNVAHVENLTLTGSALQATGNTLDNAVTGNFAANTLNGLGGHDRIVGGGDADTLLGGAGNDTLDGGAGIDSMVGGAGNDTYVLDALSEVVSELAAQGTDTVRSKVTGCVLPAEAENLVLLGTVAAGAGNAKHNLITGNDAANTLSGAGGRDTLNGGLGNDTLIGGAGADSLAGGAGNDTLVWDPNDVALAGSTGADRLKLVGAAALDLTLVDNAKITGVERIVLAGTNTLKLDAQDLLDLSGSTNTLVVDGGAEDHVELAGGGWSGPSASSPGYVTYTNGAAMLKLDADIIDIQIL